ncbi:MAG: hypothetical protein AAFQ91_13685 [Cyanobacteria bacterium J06621_15]
MTKIISAHSMLSVDKKFSAPLFKPADSTSSPSYTLNGLIIVGWVEVRNPTKTYLLLGFTSFNPTYEKLSF